MPFTDDEIREERQLRMDHMALDIEKMRADMALDQKRFFAELEERNAQAALRAKQDALQAALQAKQDALQAKQAELQAKWETRKFVVQIVAGFGAAAGGGAGLLALILHWTGRL
jgi:polyphosphate kinase 2 (PPK2 family)